MRSVIEKGEGQWVLRFLAPRRDDVKRLQSNIKNATTLFLVMNGFRNALQFVKLVPAGTIHHYGDEWSLSFTACTRSEARKMQNSVSTLVELLWWDGTHPSRRRVCTEDEVREHEERCPEFDTMFS